MNNRFSNMVSKLQQAGQDLTALEYVLIAALIAVGGVMVARALATDGDPAFDNAGSTLSSSTP